MNKTEILDHFAQLSRIEVLFDNNPVIVFRKSDNKIHFEDTNVVLDLNDVLGEYCDCLPWGAAKTEEDFCNCLTCEILQYLHMLYTNPETYTNKYPVINLILHEWQSMECNYFFDDKMTTVPLFIDEECFYIAVYGLPL